MNLKKFEKKFKTLNALTFNFFDLYVNFLYLKKN